MSMLIENNAKLLASIKGPFTRGYRIGCLETACKLFQAQMSPSHLRWAISELEALELRHKYVDDLLLGLKKQQKDSKSLEPKIKKRFERARVGTVTEQTF
jgi:hypothetical protein